MRAANGAKGSVPLVFGPKYLGVIAPKFSVWFIVPPTLVLFPPLNLICIITCVPPQTGGCYKHVLESIFSRESQNL